MRLIDADTLDETVWRLNAEGWEITRGEYKRIDAVVFEMPTVQPQRKRGKWNKGICSECNFDWGKVAPIASVPNYCPYCGAKMEAEHE